MSQKRKRPDSEKEFDEITPKLRQRAWNYFGPLRTWPAGSWNLRKNMHSKTPSDLAKQKYAPKIKKEMP